MHHITLQYPPTSSAGAMFRTMARLFFRGAGVNPEGNEYVGWPHGLRPSCCSFLSGSAQGAPHHTL